MQPFATLPMYWSLQNLFLLLASTAVIAPAQQSGLHASKPNIILILADDLSYRDLSIWGQQQFRTPTLDQLALEGVRFTQAYAGAPECAPSRGTLMTGRHTGHSAIRNNRSARGQDHLESDDITIAEILKEAGYRTGFFGKWGIDLPGTPGTPDKQGFDEAFGFYDQRRAHTFFPYFLYNNSERINYPENIGFDMEHMYADNQTLPHLRDSDSHYDANGSLIPAGIQHADEAVYSVDAIEESTLGFIRNNRDNLFFLYHATQLPHGPIVIDNLGEIAKRQDYPSMAHREWAAMVQRLDSFTGKLTKLLVDLDIRDNTLIVFASDNGYSMCGYFAKGNQPTDWPDDRFFKNKGPFRGGKFSIQEGGIRVPFFINWPAAIQPFLASTPVWLVDLLPTFTDLAGLEPRQVTDGKSLLRLLQGNPPAFDANRPLYWENSNEQAVRMGPWKAYRSSPDDPLRLYLIEEDLHGDRNLAANYPQVVAQIKKVMEQEHVDHPWYWNPGETQEDFTRKKELAISLGQLQIDTRANIVK